MGRMVQKRVARPSLSLLFFDPSERGERCGVLKKFLSICIFILHVVKKTILPGISILTFPNTNSVHEGRRISFLKTQKDPLRCPMLSKPLLSFYPFHP